MIQIIEENPKARRPSFLEKLGSGFHSAADTAGKLIPEYMMKQEEKAKQLQGLQSLKDLTGIDMTGISPEERKSLVSDLLRGKSEQSLQSAKFAHEMNLQNMKSAGDFEADKGNIDKVKDIFGENFANLYKAAPVGGRTELIKSGLDALARGIDLNEALSPYASNLSINAPQTQKEITNKKGEVPDYKLNLSGMTPKEQVGVKGDLRKENMPIWKENVDHIRNYQLLDRDVRALAKINEKKNLPEGLEKLLINPETGNFYSSVTAMKDPHPDAQMWVKILSRQATQAQTAFPGRVTNFDLQSYMQQFPSLFNTYDGRKNILKMIDLDTKAKSLFSEALDKVYKKYNADGIKPEDAHSLALKMVQDEISDIDQQLVDLAGQNEGNNEEGSAGKIDVMGPDGQEYEIDESELHLLPEGFRVL